MNIARTTSVRSLSYGDIRTYVWSAAFVACNIVLPQLCHLVPGGGLTWLPIYFFTLVAAYKFGFAAGLLTAFFARKAGRVALWAVAASVVAYQAVGTMVEWGMSGSLSVALQDIMIGWPGILMQVFGGYLAMRLIR